MSHTNLSRIAHSEPHDPPTAETSPDAPNGQPEPSCGPQPAPTFFVLPYDARRKHLRVACDLLWDALQLPDESEAREMAWREFEYYCCEHDVETEAFEHSALTFGAVLVEERRAHRESQRRETALLRQLGESRALVASLRRVAEAETANARDLAEECARLRSEVMA